MLEHKLKTYRLLDSIRYFDIRICYRRPNWYCKLNVTIALKNLIAVKILSNILILESVEEDQIGEQYSKQGSIKEVKFLNKTI